MYTSFDILFLADPVPQKSEEQQLQNLNKILKKTQ